jgi:hypothetical protein
MVAGDGHGGAGGFYAEGDINSDERGSCARANSGKVALSLIPLHLLAGAARVLMGGKLKYAEYNWAKAGAWSTAMDCTLRHITKWFWLGEDIDPDSGEHHLDHAICNLLFLRHYVDIFKEGDDRPSQDLTHFKESMIESMKNFDEESFLDRNPEIKAIVEARRAEARK